MLKADKFDSLYVLSDILPEWNLVLDPDNVFWALISKDKDLKQAIKEDLAPSYLKLKSKLTEEMEAFRFSANLTAVYINAVDRCNSQCRYCYLPPSIRRNSAEMDYPALSNVLDKINFYFKSTPGSPSKPVIVFHGTEPLLVKETIFKAIEEYSNNFLFGLQTNSLLLEKEDVEFLKKWKVNVGISLDSPSAQSNNMARPARGYNPFTRAVQALTWFDGYPGLNVISTITRYNVSRLSSLIRFLHRRKVNCVLLNPVRITRPGGRSLKPETGSLVKFFKAAVDQAIELSAAASTPILIGNFANIVLGIVAPTARRLMCDISPCGGGRCFLTISAKGDIFPCGEFLGIPQFCAENIFKNDSAASPLKEAMNSTAFKKLRARVVEGIKECAPCLYRHFCGAPCPAELYSNYKDMNQVSPYCDFYKEIISYAFRLIAEDKLKYILRPQAMGNLAYEYCL